MTASANRVRPTRHRPWPVVLPLGLLAAAALSAPAAEPAARQTRPQAEAGSAARSDREAGGFAEWLRPIDQLRLRDIQASGGLPPDESVGLFRADTIGLAHDRPWPAGNLQWTAPQLSHQPLYFDDVPLERYGQTACPLLQPALSAGRFFGTLAAMPYKLVVDHPYGCVSTLGTYRPGSPAPCVHQSMAH